jgi:hypothetical protein
MIMGIAAEPIKIDIGCGNHKRKGFVGVDQLNLPGVDIVCDLAAGRWPWDDETVSEAHCSHFIEHLTNLGGKWERVHFFNELGRVLQHGAKATLILPHWASCLYYGDPTHKEPFSEMGFYYLSRDWRRREALHTDSSVNPNGYSCDFDVVVSYSLNETVARREPEFKEFAVSWYKEAVLEIHATLTKK